MDIVTLALAKPKVVDLTAYRSADNVSINDLVLTMMMLSIEGNGEMTSYIFTDTNLAFRKALSANRHILLRMTDNTGTKTTIPTVIMNNEGTAAQATADALFYMNGLMINMRAVFLYSYAATDSELMIYVTATASPAEPTP